MLFVNRLVITTDRTTGDGGRGTEGKDGLMKHHTVGEPEHMRNLQHIVQVKDLCSL
jgi:hypothetical protein